MQKHAGPAIDAVPGNGSRPGFIGFLDLSRRQSNPTEPERLVTELECKPHGKLIF